jgi:hypothetical protein
MTLEMQGKSTRRTNTTTNAQSPTAADRKRNKGKAANAPVLLAIFVGAVPVPDVGYQSAAASNFITKD